MKLGERKFKLEGIAEMERWRDKTKGRVRLEYEQILDNWILNYWREYCPIIDYIKDRKV